MSRHAPGHFDGDGCTFPDPGHFAEYLDAADAMSGPMEPRTPCEVMETRPCVEWTGTPAAQRFPTVRCATMCWRYGRPVEPIEDA